MSITPGEIGADEDLAREVLAEARSIAPCVFTLPDGSEDRKTAIAILRRVFKDVQARGSRMVKSQRIGSAAVDYSDIVSAFAGSRSRALRSLCSSVIDPGSPVGSFPTERPISRLWPETYGS